MSKILEIKQLSARYEKGLVLKDINLSVYSEDFIGFIGPNGGGKTTLLKILLGLMPYEAGEIKYYSQGKEVSYLNMGYLAQKNEIEQKFPITAFEIIQSGLIGNNGYKFKPDKEHKRKVNAIMDQFDIRALKDANISELSGGQAQKVLLGRAVVSEPELLLLDEPNTFLDSTAESNLYALLKQLNQYMAIGLVSHDVGTISPYIKTIACINRTLHYHETNKIDQSILDGYNCPIELITHGHVPHRVLHDHK